MPEEKVSNKTFYSEEAASSEETVLCDLRFRQYFTKCVSISDKSDGTNLPFLLHSRGVVIIFHEKSSLMTIRS